MTRKNIYCQQYMTTQNDNLIESLKLTGLNETEAKIYLTCLELGPSSAWNVHKKSGLKRPTCHATLENLVADGIASKTNDGQRTIYSVAEPTELLLKIDHRRNQFKETLPLFHAITSKAVGKPKIRVFEGVEGLRQAYMLGLDQPEGGELLIFGSAKVWLENRQANKAYIDARVAKKIKLKVLFTDSRINRLMLEKDDVELREARYLPSEVYDPVVETQIFGNTIVYIAYSEKEPFATVIENKAIAHDERERFVALWDRADK